MSAHSGSDGWAAVAALGALAGAVAWGCGSQQAATGNPQPTVSSAAGANGILEAAGAAGVAGALGVGGAAGADVGSLVELPQQLAWSYPSADAPRSCMTMVTLDSVIPPAVTADAGVDGADAGAVVPPDEELPTGAVGFDAGVVERDPRPAAPRLLSQTGCFAEIAQHQVSEEFVPYLLRSPLWTDGAHKDRFFSIPPGTSIAVTVDGIWLWPVGAVLIKNFSFDFQGPNGVERRPVETRVMKRFPNGRWHYWSYQWNEEGTDAVLLEGSLEKYLTVVNQAQPLRYVYPSQLSCRTCHGFGTEGVLGPTAIQLDMEVSSQGTVRQQLDVLTELGIVEHQELAVSGLVDPANETATIEARARSYLHGNCAHCHQPGGYAPADVHMDLRITTPLEDAELCGAAVDYASEQAQVRIAPGSPENSELWLRFTTDGLSRMPMIGTGLHDPLGEALIRQWIESIERCPQ